MTSILFSRRRAERRLAGASAENSSSPTRAARPILVVGAAGDERGALAASVGTAGFTAIVSDPEATPTSLAAQTPLAVMLDVTHVPSSAAAEMVRALRRMTAAPLLAVISAHDDATGLAALDAGADDFLRRPIAVPELRARLNAHLRGVGSKG